MIEAKQTHCGQYKRYGDFFRVWNVQTDLQKDAVIEWCFQNLYTRPVPTSAEWHTNVRIGGPKFSDANYYFAGYYFIKEIDGGYEFTICEPFAD